MLYEIVVYFAAKNMGSKFLNTIQVIWEKLDETEKQMVKSFKEANGGNLIINSMFSQNELEAQVAATPYISL